MIIYYSISLYIHIYKTRSISFFFFKYLFHSLFYSFVSYHLCNFYSISFFYFFFIHIPTPLVLSPRHCVHVRLQCLQSEFVLEQKLYILERGREGGKRGEREEGGRVEWRGETPRVLSSESIQLNIDQLRFLLIHRSRILANELYLPLRENFSRTQIINRFNESFLYNRRA